MTSDFSPSGVINPMQLKVRTPSTAHHEACVDARRAKPVEREGGLVVVADPAQDADAAPKPRESHGHVAGHAARDALQMLAVDLAIARRQAIDADEDVDVDIADAEESGGSGCRSRSSLGAAWKNASTGRGQCVLGAIEDDASAAVRTGLERFACGFELRRPIVAS